MEKEIKIKTEDNKTIYGTLNSENNETLAIFVHGITGNQNEHIFFNAKKLFPKKGIDTFRFNLYDWQEGARKLSECDLHTHSTDIDLVVNYFKDKYEQIVLIGHSFGAPSILFSKQDVEAMVFWNPSCKISENIKKVEGTEFYKTQWGIESLVSQKMIDSTNELRPQITSEKFKIPTLIIVGEKDDKEKEWKTKEIKDNKNVDGKLIEGAGHCFNEENTAISLYAKTIEFIREQTRE